jgi:putative MATE family efflux protein
MGAAFIAVILRAAHGDTRISRPLMRRLLVIGRHIFVRTASLMAAFVLAGAIVARFGDAALAAHQIAFQLWIFLALVLDAIAIAGQVLVGRGLGAGDSERAYAASVRMIWLSVYAGMFFALVLLALEDVLPYAFTSDEEVIAQAQSIWPIFALMQPLNGAVFALDGILIGAGDGRYLMWSMVAAFAASAAVALAALAFDWGIVGVWSALVVLICVRLTLMLWRFSGRRWLVTGWAG